MRPELWRSVLMVGTLVSVLIVSAGDGGVRAVVAGWGRAPNVADVQQRPRVDEQGPDVEDRTGEAFAQRHPKLEGPVALVARAAAGWTSTPALDVARSRSVAVEANQVRVIVESAGHRGATEAAVRSAGGRVEAGYEDLVQALVAPDRLEQLAADPAVRYIRKPKRAVPDATNGEGVGASGATAWHNAGVSGQGARVGVIDFGFTAYTAKIASGDLPASLVVVDECNGNVTTSGGEHGTAVAEIVFEMAPAAQLFLLCVDTEVQLGRAKDYAVANGIHILTMSASWFNTGRGDGTGSSSSPSMTVKSARDNGIFWVNSAGNRGKQHYSATFSDTDGNGRHNYTAADNGNTVFLQSGAQICAWLKWDAWPTTDQNYDLLVTNSNSGAMVAQSVTQQSGSQPPTESLCYTNTTGTSQNFAIVVKKTSATQDLRFDLFVSPAPDLEYQTLAGSITEPGSSPSAVAAGAICWQNDRLESYSSQGPTIDGRIKPDIAGQSVVSSATYGPWTACPSGGDGTGDYSFNGTSASAPHVAGAAALVKGANPSFTASDIQAFLEGRAVDLGSSGKDNQFGIGKLALGAAPVATLPPLPGESCTPRPPVLIRTAVQDGRLAVTVTAAGASENRIVKIAFASGDRTPTNALLDLPDGRTNVSGSPTYTASGGVQETTFYVKRASSGSQVFVPFVVTDRCGEWPSFVGGGTSAGF